MLDTVIHAMLDFIGTYSALLTILILAVLVIGLAVCFIGKKYRFTVRDITLLGMLTALNVVMAEVCKIPLIPNVLVLSLGFLPLAITGMLFGVVPSVAVAVVADIIGALLFSSGNFYFGYTLTAFLTGLFYGIFLHKKDLSVLRCAVCQLIISMLCYALLNSIWALNWVSQAAAGEYIGVRLLAQPLLYPVYLFFLLVLRRYRKMLEGALKK